MVYRAGARAGGLDYLTVGAVLEIGAFEDDEHLAAVVAAAVQGLTGIEHGWIGGPVVVGHLGRELPGIAAAHRSGCGAL